MRCIEMSSSGAPSVLRIGTRPRPEPKRHEVLIRVLAAGVNYPDVLQRQGRYAAPPGASTLLGLEVAGVIAGLGEDVVGIALGDSVCALTPGGGYAEYCCVPALHCLPLPAGLDFVAAASLPEVYFTVWFNCFMLGGLTAGQRLLVQGGSGGIGSAAIQLASARGLQVLATAGSEEKCQACIRLGAVRAINYRTEDFVQAVRDSGRVDMVLDVVGGSYIERNLRCLADSGRLVNLGFLQGSRGEIDLIPVLKRNLTLTGSMLRPQPVAVKERIAEGVRRHVWPLVESGRIVPVVHTTFPLEHAAAAHSMLERSEHIGKIVLTVAAL